MKQFITTQQTKEIEELATEHHDALIAFGADLYSDGLVRGAIYGIVGAIVGASIYHAAKLIKKHKTNKKSES